MATAENPRTSDGRPITVDLEATGRLDALRNGDVIGPTDFSHAQLLDQDLSGLNLAGSNLTGANLSRTDLRKTVLLGANLEGAILFEARLDEAELTSANLASANLERVSGERVGLAGACLRGANLMEAKLAHSALTGADLREARLGRSDLQHCRLREADLRGADLHGADLRQADLSLARVAGAVFDAADMRDARLPGLRGFDKASWLGTDLRGINFAGAYMMRRFAQDQNYLHEFKSRGKAARAVYWVWWATSDCGRSLGRWAAMIALLVLAFAGIYALAPETVAYGDYPTWLSPLYYSVVTITTLGYGDALPTSVAGQVIAMIEVILGYMMLGGLLSILSNKMSRRAD